MLHMLECTTATRILCTRSWQVLQVEHPLILVFLSLEDNIFEKVSQAECLITGYKYYSIRSSVKLWLLAYMHKYICVCVLAEVDFVCLLSCGIVN